jgi:DNA (cytosine-5)-methyltransferase 1
MLAEAPAVRRLWAEMPYREEEATGDRPIPDVEAIIGDLPAIDSVAAANLAHYAWQHTRSMTRRMARVAEGGRWSGGVDHFSHSYGRLHRRGLARTVTTFFSNPGSGRFWHPTEDRCLSVREAARLQGFPDSFRFPVDQAMRTCRLVGNALDGALAETGYRIIREALE